MTRLATATIATAACLFAAPSSSQTGWFDTHGAPPVNRGVSMCFDDWHGRVVAIADRGDGGRMETWEWDGESWHQRRPATSPPVRRFAAFGFDSVRGVAVLFGGIDGAGERSDTWEWNGLNWSLRSPSNSPPARHSAAAAFDASRSRFVLYGGAGPSGVIGVLSDHWEWDGVDWIQRSFASTPGPRIQSSMVFDDRREVLVMTGGHWGVASDTWEFDGTTWAPVQSTGFVSELLRASLAFDRRAGRTVLYTGLGTVWEWDGVQWLERAAQGGPGSRQHAAFVYDASRDRVVLFGGGPWDRNTWIWDRSVPSWREIEFERMVLPPDAAVHLSNGRSLFLGRSYASGYSSVFDHASGLWSRAAAFTPLLSSIAMTFDTLRQRALVFGRRGSLANETWVWSQATATWSQLSVANPTSSLRAALAYDPVRDRAVLFGMAPGLDSETWEWDGNAWSQLTPPTSPPSRTDHSMAFDPTTNTVVVYGGSHGGKTFDDVWDWDGANWSQRVITSPGPVARYDAACDVRGGELLVYGGVDGSYGLLGDLWALSGSTWTRLANSSTPSAMAGAVGVVDPARSEFVIVGGRVPASWSGDPSHGVWRFGPAPARVIPFGRGCSGTATDPVLAADGLPAIGGAALTLSCEPIPTAVGAAFLFALTANVRTSVLGCPFYVPTSFAAVHRPTSAIGVASIALAMPIQPALVGQSVFVQSAALDLQSAALVTSNALRLQLGY